MVSATDSNGGVQSVNPQVVNRSPSISSVSINPSNPGSQDVLTCSVASSDLDGDTLTESIEWFIAGSSVSTNATLIFLNRCESKRRLWMWLWSTDIRGDSDQQTQLLGKTYIEQQPNQSMCRPCLPTVRRCWIRSPVSAEYSDADGGLLSIVFSYTNSKLRARHSPRRQPVQTCRPLILRALMQSMIA